MEFRYAERKDIPLILLFIKKVAKKLVLLCTFIISQLFLDGQEFIWKTYMCSRSIEVKATGKPY